MASRRRLIAAALALVAFAPAVSACVECEADCPTPEVLVVVPEPTDVAVRLCSASGCTPWAAPVVTADGGADRQVLIALPDADAEYDVQARDVSGTATRSTPFALRRAEGECGCRASSRGVVRLTADG